MGSIVHDAASLSLGTLALIIVFKGLAYGVSLGSAPGWSDLSCDVPRDHRGAAGRPSSGVRPDAGRGRA